MATISFTKEFFPQELGPAKVPDWLTLPGGLYAGEQGMNAYRQHRPTGTFSALDPEGARQRRKAEAGITDNYSLTNVAKVNPITLIDIDFQPSTLNRKTVGWSKVVLPTVPPELDYDPHPNWAILASVGRNAPFYHYSGSEDTLSFTIDWYSKEENRRDVIYYCRWLEARSKANGYFEDPHRIIIVWGEEDLLFKDTVWLVEKAKYKLSQFVKTQGMLPQQAYQEVVLKKVLATNSNYDQIMGDIVPLDTSNPYPSGIDRSTLPKGI